MFGTPIGPIKDPIVRIMDTADALEPSYLIMDKEKWDAGDREALMVETVIWDLLSGKEDFKITQIREWPMGSDIKDNELEKQLGRLIQNDDNYKKLLDAVKSPTPGQKKLLTLYGKKPPKGRKRGPSVEQFMKS